MNVLPFPVRDRVVLERVFVREVITESANGRTVERFNPPIEQFFIAFEFADGSVLDEIWSGATYAEGKAALLEYRDAGAVLIDMVGGRI